MKANVIALTLLLFVLSACEKQPAPAGSSLADALDTITEEKLSAHLTYLADDSLEGREARQPGSRAMVWRPRTSRNNMRRWALSPEALMVGTSKFH